MFPKIVLKDNLVNKTGEPGPIVFGKRARESHVNRTVLGIAIASGLRSGRSRSGTEAGRDIERIEPILNHPKN
jgi:hypothetical protein